MKKYWVILVLGILLALTGVASAEYQPPVANPSTEYEVQVDRVVYRANSVDYQGDRLVISDYYEKRGNRWYRGVDLLTISGNYIVRQHRVTTMGGQ